MITRIYEALRCSGEDCQPCSLELIGEEPLLIRIEDKPYVVVMRTPGNEMYHAAGFCLAEGIIDGRSDIETIGHDADQDPNLIDVWLRPERCALVSDILDRSGFVSQTSCGICGKEKIQDIQQLVTPAADGFEIEVDALASCMTKLSESQQHYQTTRGSHAALIFDEQLRPISFAEDVGRHNALDKAIGKALMDGALAQARVAALSSRISYELVQKAARAHLPMMISASRPTSLAVDVGKALNITMAFCTGDAPLTVVCHAQRVRGA